MSYGASTSALDKMAGGEGGGGVACLQGLSLCSDIFHAFGLERSTPLLRHNNPILRVFLRGAPHPPLYGGRSDPLRVPILLPTPRPPRSGRIGPSGVRSGRVGGPGLIPALCSRNRGSSLLRPGLIAD
jgi:hypothetical protein